ncbi:hypothetical protein HNR46_003649 [Haloferula luteola]|uniref:Type 4 fimbrial biogenesis protein PilX N-terminal domain-containing protein n=1 Tax=Haloferula luteola TaxID=595692 RepID=A0A840V5Z9_9BACT|nr:hypothetical protein [Haloferula luteola]MBB5353392.1 hypothetical protein [Haloferula luteola]
MKPLSRKQPAGYISSVVVLTLGLTVLLLMLATYRSASRAQTVQAEVTLRGDYDTKEEAVIRAIVPLAANAAMKSMMNGSDANSSSRSPLSWQKIFRQAILSSNAEESVDSVTLQSVGLGAAIIGNPGDSTTWASSTFRAYDSYDSYAMPGIDKDFGTDFPPSLNIESATIKNLDRTYPIISSKKQYGALAAGRVGADTDDYPHFNLIPYPEIRFGYAEAGEMFVAKRNWWAFKMNLGDQQKTLTQVERRDREFILSIYEVPSQLAISAEAFAVIGAYEDGNPWQNANIEGGVFASRASIQSGISLERVSGRNGLEIDEDVTIGGNALVGDTSSTGLISSDFSGSAGTTPFTPGVREKYEVTHGDFMPVSLSSESGRAAFIPINRGEEFFDRFAGSDASQTISPTSWDDYTVGARQCAMSIDITDVASSTDPTPTELTFRYQKGGVTESLVLDLNQGAAAGLPSGFIRCCAEHETVEFPYPVDVAYGINGEYYYQYGVSGSVTFENDRFGDPAYGTLKEGYYRPSFAHEIAYLGTSQPCITLYPERFKELLANLGADGPEVNNSISINANYKENAFIKKPSIPCTDSDYGVILRECSDLSSFTRGFSVVTNLRLYIADDFNQVPITPPAGSGLEEPFYPPCSMFAPEKRYGAENDPYALKISGQLGSLAGGAVAADQSVHLLDMKAASSTAMEHDKVEVNLAPIRHPAALPPITMMNWLVVIEERRPEAYEGTAVSP